MRSAVASPVGIFPKLLPSPWLFHAVSFGAVWRCDPMAGKPRNSVSVLGTVRLTAIWTAAWLRCRAMRDRVTPNPFFSRANSVSKRQGKSEITGVIRSSVKERKSVRDLVTSKDFAGTSFLTGVSVWTYVTLRIERCYDEDCNCSISLLICSYGHSDPPGVNRIVDERDKVFLGKFISETLKVLRVQPL